MVLPEDFGTLVRLWPEYTPSPGKPGCPVQSYSNAVKSYFSLPILRDTKYIVWWHPRIDWILPASPESRLERSGAAWLSSPTV